MCDGIDVIKHIQQEIEEQRRIGGFWEGYCNLQKLASGDIWESSTRYIYELLQNAEDTKATEFKIYISKKRVKIVHDGKSFDEQDVRNVCYAVSKKDPNETIGYMGVGFRSVFTVTDKPEIYSGKFRFCFNKEECLKKFGDSSLFYFYPFWIDQITESIDLNKTTFILPFKSEDYFYSSVEQIERFGAHSLLFLRNIRNIYIHNEETDESKQLNITPLEDFQELPVSEKIKEEELREVKKSKFLLVEGKNVKRFLVFRGTFNVPDYIRYDEETKRAKREKIRTREISIAFNLDEKNNLIPIKGYICSFFPIEERKINFLVHADFIVQAGRVALLDNKWNRWMMEKSRELAEVCFHYFQQNPEETKWIEQSLMIFEKREDIKEKYDDIFEKPLFNATKNPIVICIGNERLELTKAVKITEEIEELVKRGFIKCSDLKLIYGEERHLIKKDYPTGGREVEELSIDDINDKDFIKSKIERGNSRIEFLTLFYSLYKRAMERRYAHYRKDQREEFVKSDLGKLFVIDRGGNVRSQDEVWIEPDLKRFDELEKKGISVNKEQILSEFTLIDKELWDKAKDYLPKVKKITEDMIVEKCVLPKIKTSSVKPSEKDLLLYTYTLKHYNQKPKEEIWIIDDKGEIRKSSEVFLGDEYKPLYCLQKYKLPDISFTSNRYLEIDNDPEGWKEFFKNTSVRGYDESDYKDYLTRIIPILKDEKRVKDLGVSGIINYTKAIVECQFNLKEPIFVLLKDRRIERSDSEVYFPEEYSPKQNWEKQSIISFKFVSPEYIKEDNISIWKEFFKNLGVKEEASPEMIEEFGKELVRRKFEKDGYKVEPYGGYADLKAIKDEKTYFIEVRSVSSGEINSEQLDSKKAKFAQEKRHNFYLAKVINIPDAPIIYLLKDPANCEGISIEMNIPKQTIEKYAEKIDVKELLN